MHARKNGTFLSMIALFLFGLVISIRMIIVTGFTPVVLLGGSFGILIALGLFLPGLLRKKASGPPPPRLAGLSGASPIIAAMVIGVTRLVWGNDGFTFIVMVSGPFVVTIALILAILVWQALQQADAEDGNQWRDDPDRWQPRSHTRDR